MSVIPPLAVPCGSTKIVYAPATGSDFVSMKPPSVPTFVGGGTQVCPVRIGIDTFVLQQVEGPIVNAAHLQAHPPPGRAYERD